MRIFDCHTHFFSYDFFTALARQKNAEGDIDERLSDLSQRVGIAMPARDNLEHLQKWLQAFDEHGVSRAVVFSSLPEEAEAVSRAVSAAPDRLIGFCLINPLAEGAARRVHFLANHLGYRGLMLFPAMHHYHVKDPRLTPVLEAIADCRLHVLTHFGMLQVKLRDALGLPRIFDDSFANPIDLQIIANRFPSVKFIIPHFGCGYFRETLMLGAQCENVYVDTSSSNSWIKTQPYPLTLASVFHKARAVFSSERILFGTDSGVFPRGWRRDILTAQLQAMNDAGLSEEEQQAILQDNAVRLFAAS
jgi:predicted TIM-barrel fold metal-dependent hydrolase